MIRKLLNGDIDRVADIWLKTNLKAHYFISNQYWKGCVDKDDTNPTIDKIAAADMILFATPVYWWGM